MYEAQTDNRLEPTGFIGCLSGLFSKRSKNVCFADRYSTNKGGKTVLGIIAVVLIVLWLLGIVTSTTMGGFIHVLLVIAIIIVLLRVISGKRIF